MARWLLNTFPSWALAIVVLGAFVLLTLAGLAVVRRLMPERSSEHVNELAGVMAGVIAAVYGVFLAFAVVSLYEEFHEAGQDVRAEAATMSRVARNAEMLPPATAARVRTQLGEYRNAVVGPEWKAMEDGGGSQLAWRELDELYESLRVEADPPGAAGSAFYEETVGAVNELVDARRARLHGAEASLPVMLTILLIGGGVLTLGLPLVFRVPNPRWHAAMAMSLAVLLGFGLLVALLLDYPFSGDITISTAPYFEDALADL